MKADVTRAIPPFGAQSEQWIQFHKDLKSNFGKRVANSLWVKAWSIRGNSKANTGDLRSHLEDNGIKIDKSKWDSIVDMGGDFSDTIGDIFTTTKWVGIGLSIIIVGGLAMLVFNIAKNPIEAAKTAVKLKTGA